jgi:hypothetical protein
MKIMKRLSLVIAIIAAIIIAPINSYAVYWDGNALVKKFYEYEKSERKDPQTDLYETASYMGYVIGVSDAVDSLIDIPAKAKAGEICSIVGKYLKDNPEKWNLPAHQLVLESLQKAFPRKK